jgi:hypothetical protein
MVSRLRSGKGGRLSEEPETPTSAERQVFPALGFIDRTFGEGDLVSKPVIIS